ncbi:MAG: response regulator [Deltaproteobacteria bacterium]|nr:response regulator [Deltaproteobacteria bacterium]MCX7952722.1 response regulator [Deltaproteobacteria bacterium]
MKSLLLVDDDINSVEVTKCLFEQEGYDCDTALSYEDALQKVAEKNFDLAIIDLRMPGIDGNQLIKELRTKFSFPIIAFTALDTFEIQEQAIENGANCVITKPCSPKLLLDTVEKLLSSE